MELFAVGDGGSKGFLEGSNQLGVVGFARVEVNGQSARATFGIGGVGAYFFACFGAAAFEGFGGERGVQRIQVRTAGEDDVGNGLRGDTPDIFIGEAAQVEGVGFDGVFKDIDRAFGVYDGAPGFAMEGFFHFKLTAGAAHLPRGFGVYARGKVDFGGGVVVDGVLHEREAVVQGHGLVCPVNGNAEGQEESCGNQQSHSRSVRDFRGDYKSALVNRKIRLTLRVALFRTT